VPVDARRLNVAVIWLRLESGEPTIEPRLRFPPQVTRGLAPFDGMFMDGWVAGKAQFQFQACGAAPAVHLEGEAPAFPGHRFPKPVELQVDGEPVQTLEIAAPGNFRFDRPVQPPPAGESCRPMRVTVRPLGEAFRSAADQRELAIRLTQVAASQSR